MTASTNMFHKMHLIRSASGRHDSKIFAAPAARASPGITPSHSPSVVDPSALREPPAAPSSRCTRVPGPEQTNEPSLAKLGAPGGLLALVLNEYWRPSQARRYRWCGCFGGSRKKIRRPELPGSSYALLGSMRTSSAKVRFFLREVFIRQYILVSTPRARYAGVCPAARARIRPAT